MTGVFSKVVAASAGAGGGAVAAGLVVWLLGLAWGGSPAAADVEATTALVPGPVGAAALFALTVVGAGLAGFLKKEDPARLATYLDDALAAEEEARPAPYDDGEHAAEPTDGAQRAGEAATLAREELVFGDDDVLRGTRPPRT